MYKVKLTISPYDKGLERQLPKGINEWRNYRFYIDEDVDEVDFWVVLFRAFKGEKETCIVAPENTLFITQEPDSVYRYSQGFLDQFGTVISCQRTLKHKNVIHDIPANAWWNGKIIKGPSNVEYSHSYDDYLTIVPPKTKLISVISSDKVFTKGHRERLDFVMKLKNYYGDKLDLFGHGNHSFDDKWDALAPYKYHICLENCAQKDYWTEKLADAFLSNTFPLYYGCTNVYDYFDKDALRLIDIHNVEQSINIIDDAIKTDLAHKNATAVQKAKMSVLNEYNLFNLITKYCDQMNPNLPKQQVTMRPDLSFFDLKKISIVMGRRLSELKFKFFGV